MSLTSRDSLYLSEVHLGRHADKGWLEKLFIYMCVYRYHFYVASADVTSPSSVLLYVAGASSFGSSHAGRRGIQEGITSWLSRLHGEDQLR